MTEVHKINHLIAKSIFFYTVLFSLAKPVHASEQCLALFADMKINSNTSPIRLVINALKNQNKDVQIPTHLKLFGRVVRVPKEIPIKTRQQLGTLKLTSDAGRDLAMVFDRTGVNKLLGHTPNKMLDILGYNETQIKDIKATKTRLVLVLYESSGHDFQASWKNLREFLGQNYGELALMLFDRYFPQLEFAALHGEKGLKLIEAEGPMKFADNLKLGEQHPDYVDFNKLTLTSSLWHFRAFLFNQLRLNGLYTGNGETATENGKQGVPEYFIKNQPIEDLKSWEAIRLI